RDWSSDVCSSDLAGARTRTGPAGGAPAGPVAWEPAQNGVSVKAVWRARGPSVRRDELLLLGGALQGRGRGVRRDRRAHQVEVAGADLALVARGGVAVPLGRELALLQLDVGGHARVRVPVGELEHRVVEGVEAGQGDELELVPHVAELALELGDRRVVQVPLPVERGRAVVGEHLVRVL